MKKSFNVCWLTVNRACNLRCKWCYAYDAGFNVTDEMSLENAKAAIDLCVEAGIKKIILIGGEPTLYTHLHEVIRYAKANKILPALVTNGILLENEEFVKTLMRDGVNTFSVSLKAPNKKGYTSLTGADVFDKVIKAINNLSKHKANFSVSTVITNLNVENFIDGLIVARDNGCKNFGISFCYNFDMNDNSRQEFLANNNPYIISKAFYKQYPRLCKELSSCRWSLEQSLPLCIWEEDAISTMDNNHHLRSICQLLRGNGLLFDTDLSLIPCNAMYKLKYGKYNKDFHDYQSLCDYLNTKPVTDLFAKLRGMPHSDCSTCSKASKCGGGCVTNWTNYTFEQLKSLKESPNT